MMTKIKDHAISGLPAVFLRKEQAGTLTAAVEWGLQRCRSDAARALLPPLAALLSPFNATILPVDHSEDAGPAVDFRVTLSRPLDAGRAHRLRFALLSERPSNESIPSMQVESRLIILIVNASHCVDAPWLTAGELVGQILAAAVGKAEECGGCEQDAPR